MDAQILRRYESLWSSGDSPRIEDFLSADSREVQQRDFCELLRCELKCRSQRGETPLPTDYELRFPQFIEVISQVFAEDTAGPGFAAEQATLSFHGSAGSASTPTMPQSLGRFQLEELIGRGGFGAVYRAYDSQLDRVVAIKLPRAGGAIDEAQLRRFLHEARAAAQLIHPNIVPVFDAGQIGAQHYIASEFIRGESLRKWLQQHAPVSFAQAAEMVAVLASALHFAHTKGIVHRDVKPDNVMIDAAGKLYLTDFGLARREEELQTQDGTQLGTPAYMSPEQVSGKSNQADPRTDVWAVGVMLYELLSGERPFCGTVAEIYHGIARSEPAELAHHARKPPRDLVTICFRCLAKDPAARFQSAAELAAELRRWLAGEPILSRPAGRLEKGWRWCRRNAPLAIAGSIAMVAIVSILIGSAGFGIYRRRATQSLATAKAEISTKQATAEKAEARATEEEQAKTDKLVQEAMDRGVEHCRNGDIVMGLFHLVESLELGAELPKNPWESAARLNLDFWSQQLPVLNHQFKIEKDTYCAQLAPDGVTMVARKGEKVARYDVTTGLPIGKPLTLSRHPYETQHLRNHQLLCIFRDKPAIEWWDLASGTQRHLGFEFPFEQAHDAILSQAAQRLAVLDMHGIVHLFALDQRSPIEGEFTKSTGKVYRIELLPNERQFVTLDREGWFKTWNLEDGKRSAPYFKLKIGPGEIKFDETGGLMLSTGANQRITVLNTDLLEEVSQSVEIQQPGERSLLAFSSNGRRAAMVDRSLVRFFQFVSGNTSRGVVLRNAEQVIGLGMHPDGQSLFAADRAAQVQVWNLPDSPSVKIFKHPDFIRDLAVSADGKKLAAAGGRGFTLVHLDSPERCEFHEHPSNAFDIQFSRTGHRIVVRQQGADVTLDGSGRAIVDPFAPFSPYGTKVYSSDEQLLIRRENPRGFSQPTSIDSWDVRTKQQIARLEPQEHGYLAMGLSPNDRFLALACSDGKIRVLDPRTLKETIAPLPCGTIATALAWSGDGKVLAGGSRAGVVQVWRMPEGKLAGTETLDDSIAALHLSNDGSTILAQGSHVAGVLEGQDTLKLTGLIQHQGIVKSALSPDGHFCVTNSTDGAAQLWHTGSTRTIGPLTRSEHRIMAVLFLPNGQDWAWADYQGKICVEPLPRLTPGEPAELMACLHAATGQRMNDNSILEPLPAAEWQTLKNAWQPRTSWPLSVLRETAQLAIKPRAVAVTALPATRKLPVPTSEHAETGRLVKALGGMVEVTEETIHGVSFHPTTNVPDRNLLEKIVRLPGLRSLNLGVLPFNDVDVALLQHCPELRSLVIKCPALSDQGLKEIAVALPHLENLRLEGARITDEGTAVLVELTQLDALGINKSNITDKALKNLAQLPRLRQLYLADTLISHSAVQRMRVEKPALHVFHSVTPTGSAVAKAPTPTAPTTPKPVAAPKPVPGKPETAWLLEALGGRITLSGEAITKIDFYQVQKFPDPELIKKIGELKSLRSLHLGSTPCTDEDAISLAGCEALTNLVMLGPGITDRGLETLAKLRNLENLRLAESKITDEGIAVLSGLDKLRDLGLTQCEISDAATIQLQLLPKIESLYLNDTNVTVQGMNKIRIMKPRLQIFSNAHLKPGGKKE